MHRIVWVGALITILAQIAPVGVRRVGFDDNTEESNVRVPESFSKSTYRHETNGHVDVSVRSAPTELQKQDLNHKHTKEQRLDAAEQRSSELAETFKENTTNASSAKPKEDMQEFYQMRSGHQEASKRVLNMEPKSHIAAPNPPVDPKQIQHSATTVFSLFAFLCVFWVPILCNYVYNSKHILANQGTGGNVKLQLHEAVIVKPVTLKEEGNVQFKLGYIQVGTFEYHIHVKCISRGSGSEHLEERLNNEGRILRRLKCHPNIIGFCGGPYSLGSHLYLLLEESDMNLGEEVQVTETNQSLDFLEIFHNIACGLYHMYLSDVMYTSLCAKNIVIKGDVAKIADFSLAMVKENSKWAVLDIPCITSYTAPEVLTAKMLDLYLDADQETTTKCVAYTLGMIMWECIVGEDPPSILEDPPNILEKSSLAIKLDNALSKEKRKPFKFRKFNSRSFKRLKKLVLACINRHPSNRPEIENVIIELFHLLMVRQHMLYLPYQQGM